ncbi:membrane protease YdiL (CAAX protease family) [Bacillus ectoiniformans]|uniref:CPBP family intramembrane glutamic endopeptidase n=1 Tax=Bacillus ectoiniformans TaxID=1494429 RepID=UPI00195975F3|nr:CPBP family intramembrane glutamic endopeptidase [Bacillus ectoiniformans]MBM7648530.1 membrane protease YdiL (CAAX protease family) [Bacillus ectoiniformans]
MQKNIILTLLALLFFSGIIIVSLKIWNVFPSLFIVLLFILAVNKQYRFLSGIFIAFLLGFLGFQLMTEVVERFSLSEEWQVVLKRSSLLLIAASLISVLLLHNKQVAFFQHKLNWNQPMHLPFHTIKTSYFLMSAFIINIAIFIPFIAQQQWNEIQSILLFAFAFSLINAILEELIWRGLLLSALKKQVSQLYAITITSLGFGLQHLSIGFPLSTSLLFSFGGVFYAIVVLKTNSIYPAMFLHFVINMGMVLSGWILI